MFRVKPFPSVRCISTLTSFTSSYSIIFLIQGEFIGLYDETILQNTDFFPIIFKILLVRFRSWFPGNHLDSNLGSLSDSWTVVIMNKLLNLTRNNYKKI